MGAARRVCGGATGKTDRKEAEAVEQMLKLAHAGKTPRARLMAMVAAMMGGQRAGLPLKVEFA